MAINKEKNVTLQVTFPKEDAQQLEELKVAFHKVGIKVSKSDILVRAFRDYLRMIILSGAKPVEEQKEAKEDKRDA